MGSKAKQRPCLVAGRTLTAAECASGRHSQYACPESCPFNPFSPANYQLYLQTETGVEDKFTKWLIQAAPDRAQFESNLLRKLGTSPNPEFYNYLVWKGFYETNAVGETRLDQWAKAGYSGLKNDEKVIIRALGQMRVALLEAHHVMDDLRVQVVDLLDPEQRPMIIADRSFAARAVRFTVLMGYVLELPHFCRIFGVGQQLPPLEPFTTEEALAQIIAHLGGPAEAPARRRWMAEHYARLGDAFYAVAQARHRATIENLDACFGKAIYELRQPLAECRAVLDVVPEIADDPIGAQERNEGFSEGRVWFAKPGDAPVTVPHSVRGRILLGHKFWRVEAMGGARLDQLRQDFERLMGERVRFSAERRDNLGARLLAEEPAYDTRLVPPSLLAKPRQFLLSSSRVPITKPNLPPEQALQDHMATMARDFLDNSVPALEGKTPRAAAADPVLRPKLVSLLKCRIRDQDERNLQEGTQTDLNWMLEELGLQEILFPPPPSRPPIRPPSLSAAGLDGSYLEDLAPPPPLPTQPLTIEEAAERYIAVLDAFPDLADAVDHLFDVDCLALEDLYTLSEGLLSESEFSFLEPFLAAVVLCFAPPGTRPPELAPDALRAALDSSIEALAADLTGDSNSAIERWVRTSRQPGILKMATRDLVLQIEDTPADQRPSDLARISMMFLLRILVDELDRAMRR